MTSLHKKLISFRNSTHNAPKCLTIYHYTSRPPKCWAGLQILRLDLITWWRVIDRWIQTIRPTDRPQTFSSRRSPVPKGVRFSTNVSSRLLHLMTSLRQPKLQVEQRRRFGRRVISLRRVQRWKAATFRRRASEWRATYTAGREVDCTSKTDCRRPASFHCRQVHGQRRRHGSIQLSTAHHHNFPAKHIKFSIYFAISNSLI